jgi:hypothetical protein
MSPRASRSSSQRAASLAVRLVSSNPSHVPIIRDCIRLWQVTTTNKHRTLVTLLDRFERDERRVQMLKQANSDWSHLRRPLSVAMVQIRRTASQLVRCKTSLVFWTDVSRGTAEGPPLRMMTTDAGRIRAMGYLPPQYVSQLRAETAALPDRVNRSTLAAFRSL